MHSIESQDEEFQHRYLSSIINSLDRLELFGLDRVDELQRRQKLSIAYVSLDFEVGFSKAFSVQIQNEEGYESRERNIRAHFNDTFRDVITHADLGTGTNVSLDYAQYLSASMSTTWLDLLRKNYTGATHALRQQQTQSFPIRLLIRGRAGSGKTTLLKWFAISYAKASIGANAPKNLLVPFYVRLRDYAGKSFPPPEQLVSSIVRNVFEEMPRGWVNRLLKSGRAIVLIDGLDEIPHAERTAMLDAFNRLMENFPLSRYVISSRPQAIDGDGWPEWERWCQKQRFITLSIQDMTPNEMYRLIDQWHQALAEDAENDDERAFIEGLPQSLKRKLSDRPELRRLAVNPLLCAMLCTVHHGQRNNLPKDRARLYEQCVEMLLYRRDYARKVPLSDYPNLSETQRLEIVQSLAYWFLKNGYTSATHEDVDSHVGSLLRIMQVGETTPDGVRRLLVERSDLLREPVLGQIDFAHRTFLEYLAAKAAVAEADWGVLYEKRLDDQWYETIVIAVGQMRHSEAEKYLRRLITGAVDDPSPEVRRRLVLLSVASLETVVRLDPALRQEILDLAVALVPPDSETTSTELAKAGDSIAASLMPNEDYSSSEAGSCIQTLAQIDLDELWKS
ncbi:MAG: NACHT domain-containing protein [Anaerolineales bacterium]|nr:NACHT domain-containing protein [Anaerolineales bacterium]